MSEASLRALIARIEPACAETAARAQQCLDGKTKPRGSLGRVEELARRLCAMRRSLEPRATEAAIVVMAADHGVAAEGVSAYPQEVTRQMLLNFARGGAAINVLAKQVGARVVVVDMGVSEAVEDGAIRAVRVGPGTANLRTQPAMSRAQAMTAISAGAAIADELAGSGVGIVGLGEMGIGNTTASSAIAAALTGVAPEEVTGRGTGIDDEARRNKVAVIRQAVATHAGDGVAPLDVLARLGGFEIAGLAGVALGAAAHRLPVVVDGFISSVAALVAVRLAPCLRDYLICAHRSVEPGHRVVLRELATPPLLDLDLRLGEGTGAALVIPLIRAADAIVTDMASFDSAGVTDTGK